MPRFLVPALTALLFVALACGTESASQPDSTGASAPESEQALTVFERLLALVPDTPETRFVTVMNDIEALLSIHGMDLPPAGASADEVLEFKKELWLGTRDTKDRDSFARIMILGGDDLAGFNREYFLEEGVPDTATTLGFDVRDIDAWVVAAGTERAGQTGLEMLLGSFDPQRTSELIEACAECPAHQVISYLDAEYFSWGDAASLKLTNRFKPPLFDYLGRGGNILVQDDRAYRAMDREDMELIVETSTGSHPNLGADGGYVGVVRLLTAGGAVSALLTTEVFSLDSFIEGFAGGVENIPRLIEREALPADFPDGAVAALSATKSVPPPGVTGVGFTADASGRFILLALAYDDDAEAQSAADALRERLDSGPYPLPRGRGGELQPWTEVFTRRDVAVDGRFVVLELHSPDPMAGAGFTVANSGAIGDVLVGTTLGFLLATD